MLDRLLIKDLVTIPKLEIEFDAKLNIITGETGSGKSLILKAINLIYGEKSDKGLIREGESACIIEASFSKLPLLLKTELKELGLEDGENLNIRRKIGADGKNVIFVNDMKVSLKTLQSLTSFIFDIHSQNSQFEILKKGNYIHLLDQFAQLTSEVENYSVKFKQLKRFTKELKELQEKQSELEKKQDFLQFQSDEIENTHLNVEEEKMLYEKNKIFSQQEKLVEYIQAITEWENLDVSPIYQIETAFQSLQKAADIDNSLNGNAKELEESLLLLKETQNAISNYASRLESDSSEIERTNERLAEIEKIKRKYGATIQDVFEYKQKIDTELSSIKDNQLNFSTLEKKIQSLKDQLCTEGQFLEKVRTDKKGIFESSLLKELSKVGLEKSSFIIQIQRNSESLEDMESIGPYGLNEINFEISTNPGIPVTGLHKVASGGEISRIVLAIKSITQNQDIKPTMIFDEIDAGISGLTAEKVGEKLKLLSRENQLICITHLPQIACKSDQHLKVEKRVENKRTISQVKTLHFEEKVEELARFIGGGNNNDSYLKAAKEMLQQ